MGTAGQSITLANSIIGVGILAMPFCFQQCGVLLATMILLFMGLISRLCCHFLLKAALIARRRNFEFLAFHVFGSAGKLAVEVGIIGFLMGTCIAYFVVVGDLGPQIVAKLFNINQSDILRTSIMVLVSLVCVLPLGLLRNVDSLSNVSAATIGFYFCLVIKVITEAASQLVGVSWRSVGSVAGVSGVGSVGGVGGVALWRPAGLLQCVPIFSMALFCQTQLFEIFESLPTLSLEKMNVVTKNAINICTAVYFTLGLFGYIAFCSQNISGNILMSLSPTMANDVIKLGFVMSLAFSFPLIIFPCRASLYSFLYRKAHPAHHDHIINHSIPEATFRCITVGIIGVALFISLLIPNIELVLGLVGSTIGVLICVVFPAACFINVTFRDTNERVLAKAVLVLGLVILVLGTYANLQAAETQHERYDDKITPERIDKIVEDFFQNMEKQELKPANDKPAIQNGVVKEEPEKDSVIQPPNPVPPASNEKPQAAEEPKEEERIIKPKPPRKEPKKLVQVDPNVLDKASETHPKDLQTKLNEIKASNNEPIQDKVVEKSKEETKPQSKQDKAEEKNDMIKQQQLIETIKQHGEEQKELIKEQKEILDELIKTKKELQQNKKEIESSEAKKIAVESIQKIADIAIKSLAGVTEKVESEKKDVKNEPLENIASEVVQEIAKKAVEAVEVLKEQKPVEELKLQSKNEDINTGNAVNVPNNVNSNFIQNNGQIKQNVQLNVPNNVAPPSVSNFAPINPPIVNHNSVNVPSPELPKAEALVQKENMAPPQQPNNAPMLQNNDPQPIIKHIVDNIRAGPSNDGVQPKPDQHQDIQQNQINVKQYEANPQSNQIIYQQENQNLQQNNINQQQHQFKQQKREVENQFAQKNNIIENGQNAQTIQNNQLLENQQNKNVEPKNVHSHSPDQPQSYKQGEDSQKQPEMVKSIAQNVPVPIPINENAQLNHAVNGNKEAIEQPIEATNNGVNKVQIENNGAKTNLNNMDLNANPARQKREVTDCTETMSLAPQDKENCKAIIDSKVDSKNIKIEQRSEEILPSNVDLGQVGLKNMPLEIIHHGRSLKSIEKMEKKR